jgi:prepilin-type processing-associated H-X9-DG protein
MGKTKNNTRNQKMKTSKMAIVSPLLSVLGVSLLVLLLYWEDVYKLFGLSLIPFYLTRFYVYGHLISGLMVIAGIVVGVLVIKKGQDKRRISKEKRFAIDGIVLGVVFFVFWIFHSPDSAFTARKRCAANLQALGRWMILYAGDYDEQYPQAGKWCDLLTEYLKPTIDNRLIEKCFICPANKKGRCGYAMNPNLSPRSQPGQVLLFETEGGWNQTGGPEILTVENHRGKGCNVLFNDSHVEFVRAEEISELKWTISEDISDK